MSRGPASIPLLEAPRTLTSHKEPPRGSTWKPQPLSAPAAPAPTVPMWPAHLPSRTQTLYSPLFPDPLTPLSRTPSTPLPLRGPGPARTEPTVPWPQQLSLPSHGGCRPGFSVSSLASWLNYIGWTVPSALRKPHHGSSQLHIPARASCFLSEVTQERQFLCKGVSLHNKQFP